MQPPEMGSVVVVPQVGGLHHRYERRNDLDLVKYRAVSIRCKRFSVNFGAAPLRPTKFSPNR
jgi:hypothetical protein